MEASVTYEEFVRLRLQALTRHAVMLTGDPHTAADLVQETMIRVQMNWQRVAAADVPERYVRRMLANAHADWWRASWRRRVVLRSEPIVAPAAGEHGGTDHAEASAERDEMWAWLATLPRRQQAVLVLRYYEGLTDAEIAEVLGCAAGTVRGYVSRALVALRSQVASAMPAKVAAAPRRYAGSRVRLVA
jgi:RNA polymerase sigma-70 factor (sigma-E family)